MDDQIRMCNIERQTSSQVLVSSELVSKIVFLPFDDNVFLSCHHDGKVRRTDLREPAPARTTVFVKMPSVHSTSRLASALSFDPLDARQCVLCGGDEVLRIFDLRRPAAAQYVRRIRAADLVDERASVNASGRCAPRRRFVLILMPLSNHAGVAWGPNKKIAVTWQDFPAMIFDVSSQLEADRYAATELREAARAAAWNVPDDETTTTDAPTPIADQSRRSIPTLTRVHNRLVCFCCFVIEFFFNTVDVQFGHKNHDTFLKVTLFMFLTF